MANLVRSAKSANDWTSADLQAYNIRISTVDTEEFFGVAHLPAPTVDPIVLNNVDAFIGLGSQLSLVIRRFFQYLRKVVTPPTAPYDYAAAHEEAPYIVDFSFHILRDLLRLDGFDRRVVRSYIQRFIVSGKLVKAKFDVALLDSKATGSFLLILEDNSSPERPQDQAEPRLVAKALAAFQIDDYNRTAIGLPPMLSKSYIGIVMTGAGPQSFHKISLTRTLVYAVRHGLFPAEETVVQRYILPVPNMCEGMLSLENRHVYFQCLEALKLLL